MGLRSVSDGGWQYFWTGAAFGFCVGALLASVLTVVIYI